jgi:hypothetical protein
MIEQSFGREESKRSMSKLELSSANRSRVTQEIVETVGPRNSTALLKSTVLGNDASNDIEAQVVINNEESANSSNLDKQVKTIFNCSNQFQGGRWV